MDQLRIIFKILQVMKMDDEAEIGLERNLSPLKDVSALQNLEEQLQSNPDLQKQLVCWHGDHNSLNRVASFYLPQMPFFLIIKILDKLKQCNETPQKIKFVI